MSLTQVEGQSFDPTWFYSLEQAEVNLRGQIQTPLLPFGTLNLSPLHPLWSNGNCFAVHTLNEAILSASDDEISRCIDSVEAAFAEACPTVKRTFLLTRPLPAAPTKLAETPSQLATQNAVNHRIKPFLLARGYTLDDDPEENRNVCMALIPSMLVPAPHATDGRTIRRATPSDVEHLLILEPGDANASWRRIKSEEVAHRSEERGGAYICFNASGVPVARVIIAMQGKVAFLARVNTHPDHWRKGYARSLLTYACKDLFERGTADQIVLFAGEEGPIKLYSGLGMRILAEHSDVEFVKKAAEF